MPDPARLPDKSVTECLAERIARLDVTQLPSETRRVCEDLLVDVVGLCLVARKENYVKAALEAWDERGPAAKFATPYCIATGLVRGNVGLDDFSDAAIRDARVLALASKVRYRIDPQNPYPDNFTGHVCAVLADGSVIEERQPHIRGGTREPLTRADIEAKFLLNACRRGLAARAQETLAALRRLYAEPILDMKPFRGDICR